MRYVIFGSFIVMAHAVFAQKMKVLDQAAFVPGEELVYKLKYGMLAAAEGRLSIEKGKETIDGKPTYHLVAKGSTSGAFSVLYKVHDRYDSYIDRKSFVPIYFTETIHEGSYKRNSKVRFYPGEKKLLSTKDKEEGKEFVTRSSQTFDILSSYYFFRVLDLTNIKEGSTFTVDYFLNEDLDHLTIKYIGKEKIKTHLGTLNCLKFSPEIKPGRVFRKDSQVFLWVTDDGNRIPVKAEIEILIGKITMELQRASGLKYPLETNK